MSLLSVQGDSTPPVAAISPTRLKELAALLHTLASKVGLGTAACSRCFDPAACCRLE